MNGLAVVITSYSGVVFTATIPASEISLIACDLDGTLLGTDNQISSRSLKVVQTVVDSGITFVPCTGRSFRSVVDLVSEITGLRWLICSNGAVLYDLANQNLVDVRGVPASVASSTVSRLEQWSNHFCFAWETSAGFGSDKSFYDQHELFLNRREVRPVPRLDVSIEGIIKILLGHPALGREELLKAAQTALEDAPAEEAVTVLGSGASFVEITGAGVNKGSALASLCERLHVDARSTMAIGDQDNDISMLQWAGYPIAMGNADVAVKQVADYQTLSNSSDGVAEVIERLVQ